MIDFNADEIDKNDLKEGLNCLSALLKRAYKLNDAEEIFVNPIFSVSALYVAVKFLESDSTPQLITDKKLIVILSGLAAGILHNHGKKLDATLEHLKAGGLQ